MQLHAIALPTPPLPPEIFAHLISLLPEDSQARINRFRLPEDALRTSAPSTAHLPHPPDPSPQEPSLAAWPPYGTSVEPVSSRPPRSPCSSVEPGGDRSSYDLPSPPVGRVLRSRPAQVDPVLKPPLAFNDSHDGALVLLGVVRGASPEIGVDLMQLPPGPLAVQEGISEQLVPAERQALAVPLSERERARRVTALWTLKEGYTKAVGEGIGFGLERVRVDLGLGEDGEGLERERRVRVDGRDVEEDGWACASGWLGADGEYGWAAFWRGDGEASSEIHVEEVAWEDFLRVFDER